MLCPIRTVADARTFIRALHDDDAMFHLEDDPADILCGYGGGDLFSLTEVDAIRERQNEMYQLEGFDPCAFALSLMEGGESADYDEDDDRQRLTKA
jgi:hypothetical protein